MRELHWINPLDPELSFPDVEQALRDPDGLLAVGGDLSPDRLLKAYRLGIFPWFSDGQPILWWSPDPRMVLFPSELKISRSLKKTLRKAVFRVSRDSQFDAVIRACAAPRHGADGTWITDNMIDAYSALHERGYAHSVETWLDDELVGGLYGVSLGNIFFGESMFSRRTDASKVAFAWLARDLEQHGFKAIDCQVHSAHMASLGARDIPRAAFTRLLTDDVNTSAASIDWCQPFALDSNSW